MDYPTFWMQATDRCCVTLGRWTQSTVSKCPGATNAGHHASALILTDEPWSEWERIEDTGHSEGKRVLVQVRDIAADDPRWPTTCE